MAQGMAGAWIVAVLLLMVLAIVWILLPLAIVGIKPLLRQVLAEQRAQTVLLNALLEEARAARSQN